jgi:hypothetical protein
MPFTGKLWNARIENCHTGSHRTDGRGPNLNREFLASMSFANSKLVAILEKLAGALSVKLQRIFTLEQVSYNLCLAIGCT